MSARSSERRACPLRAAASARKEIAGWPSGTAKDSEETLAFSAFTGVRPMIEKMPLTQAQAAFDKMMSGKARFRMVLETGA